MHCQMRPKAEWTRRRVCAGVADARVALILGSAVAHLQSSEGRCTFCQRVPTNRGLRPFAPTATSTSYTHLSSFLNQCVSERQTHRSDDCVLRHDCCVTQRDDSH